MAGVGILGSTTAHFDNVVLAPAPPGGGVKGEGSSLSGTQLSALMRSSLASPVVMKGKRLFVKAKCPAAVGTSCRISLRGLLNKKKPATGTRSAKVAQGKTKRFALKVKPEARPKLTSRKRLLFKLRVRAGGANATMFKSLRLVRR